MIVAVPLPASPPLDPGVEEARSWLAHELALPAYADDRSLLQRILDWLQEHLSGAWAARSRRPSGLSRWCWWCSLSWSSRSCSSRFDARPPSRAPPRWVGCSTIPSSTRTATGPAPSRPFNAVMLAAATADAFRAIAAASAERTLLDDVPGHTAHEIGAALALVFPAEWDEVRGAADLFDRVVYGRASVGLDDARSVLDLDSRLRATRPVLAATGRGGVTGGPAPPAA